MHYIFNILLISHNKNISDKESNLIQFILRSDMTVTSANPLKPIENSNSDMEIDLPNIHPLHHTIGLDKTNIYTTEDEYRKFNAHSNIYNLNSFPIQIPQFQYIQYISNIIKYINNSYQHNIALDKHPYYLCALRSRGSEKSIGITCDARSDFRSHSDKNIHRSSGLCTAEVWFIREETARTRDCAMRSIGWKELSLLHISTQFVRRQ